MATKKVSAALPESAPAPEVAPAPPVAPVPEPTVADEWRRVASDLHNPDPGARGPGSLSVPPDGAARTEGR